MQNTLRSTTILIVTIATLLNKAFAQEKDSASRTLDTLAQQLKMTAGERWYKNCFIYNLDVRTFQDSDGDGIGDFRGLTARLPYLKKLGVDVIWLAPFQPSPHKDDGYDVTDYYAIDPSCGTPGDFAEFLYQAHTLGMRVMMDMILAHTSDQHPWFQKASADTTSPYYHWYFWSKTRPAVADSGTAFPGVQKETWTFQDTAWQYYFHRFYDFQPHLNFTNPAVLVEAEHILAYWIDQGIDGFRLDAVPFLIEIPKTNDPNSDQSLTLITTLRQFVQWRRGDIVLLGEANVPPPKITDYFGQTGDRLHMLFNFFGNQFLFYSLATHDPTSLRWALEQTRLANPVSQWCWFLRNHDEVDLGRLTDAQRQTAYKILGPDKNMQLYNRGIRRRLAPMLHDKKQLEMAYSLMFALPGSEELHYGEELGMGDDLSLQERLAVRTPMQWSHETNAGFSTSPHPIRPLITSSDYSYTKINVQDEELDSNSLLEHITRLIKLRKACPEIGLGDWSIPDSSQKQLLVIRYEYEKDALVIVHNFSPDPQPFNTSTAMRDKEIFIDLLTGTGAGSGGRVQPSNRQPITIPGYGYKWYRRITP
jgi:maltose alpha-D-glucosyltransferase/alpha-amylase